jgi:hypothetical protein
MYLPSSVDQPVIKKLNIPSYVAPVGNSVVTILDTVPLDNGAGIMLNLRIFSGDFTVVADRRSTLIQADFRVFAGNLGTVPVLGGIISTTAGGAGTFSADVTFVAVSLTGGGRLELVASNAAGAPLTGRILARWWTERAAWG